MVPTLISFHSGYESTQIDEGLEDRDEGASLVMKSYISDYGGPKQGETNQMRRGYLTDIQHRRIDIEPVCKTCGQTRMNTESTDADRSRDLPSRRRPM